MIILLKKIAFIQYDDYATPINNFRIQNGKYVDGKTELIY